MLVLLGIGVLAGLVTAISPCVLPVLPVLLAGGAAGRQPLRIIGGLVISFVVFTLYASWLLDQLGLPQDLLRNLAIALLLVVAVTLLVPHIGALLERPFARLSRFRARGRGFLLGISLGLVFVPCAGPVLAAISVVAAENRVGWRAVLLTVAYAVGAVIPMLLVALGGRRGARLVRHSAPALRIASGAVVGAVALALVFHLDDRTAEFVPGYTDFLQSKIERSATASSELARIRGDKPRTPSSTSSLGTYGAAQELHAGGAWFNSPPLSLASLRGKVVLIDFWTYSCINCLRTLPHLKAWDAEYRKDGLVIVGVHTPEFAFEHVASNVAEAVTRLGIAYPVMQDNDYATWRAYGNQYWPADYLIDRQGELRDVHFGEGSYDQTENAIRELLGTSDSAEPIADQTPTDATTPESYLGYRRLERYSGSPIERNRFADYTYARSLPQSILSYAGRWRVESERIVAGRDARLRFHVFAKDVYLVLGGRGRVQVAIGGKRALAVDVDAYRLYTLRRSSVLTDASLELRFTPGLAAYAFTFG